MTSSLWRELQTHCSERTVIGCVGVRLTTQKSTVHRSPPPPSKGVFRAFLRMHRPLTSTFGRRFLCLWGQFMGTYSTSAQGKRAARKGTIGATRWGFAHRGGRRASAAQGMPYAAPCSCTTQGAPPRCTHFMGVASGQGHGFESPAVDTPSVIPTCRHTT